MAIIKGIRIVSDGSVMGTRVFSSDGEDVTRKLEIRAINWRHHAGGIPVAVLTCQLAAIEASGIDVEVSESTLIEECTHLASKARDYRLKP